MVQQFTWYSSNISSAEPSLMASPCMADAPATRTAVSSDAEGSIEFSATFAPDGTGQSKVIVAMHGCAVSSNAEGPTVFSATSSPEAEDRAQSYCCVLLG
mgnify:CR=1 FL=1